MFLSTGKSKAFAHLLNEVFLHGFDSKVICMEDYRVTDIENEQCVLVVASTFGNGEPPDNCLLYTSPSPRDKRQSRMPSSA